jgi:hypothetical protein
LGKKSILHVQFSIDRERVRDNSRIRPQAYPSLHASEILDFPNLVRKGKPVRNEKPAEGQDKKAIDQEHERSEFLKSIAYMRDHCGAGLKT